MRSSLLVIGQFGSIAVLLIGGDWLLPIWAWILFMLGLVVFFLALIALGGSNFTIMPSPRAGNVLSKRGIYHLMRHPMYTAVILCGTAVTFGSPSVARWIALAVCVVVLLLKVHHEEGLLTARHPDYPRLMKGVARLLPGIW